MTGFDGIPIERLPWPLVTIDFEASSLDVGTFPIEIGVCRWRSPSDPIEGWGTLIRATPEWRERGSWWRSSEDIHGIRREELDAGMEPVAIVAALNAIIGEHLAFCDGGGSDAAWCAQLVRAAEVAPAFRLGDFDQLALGLPQLGYMRLMRWMERTPARHRARADAERLMKAFARGLSLEHGTSATIEVVA